MNYYFQYPIVFTYVIPNQLTLPVEKEQEKIIVKAEALQETSLSDSNFLNPFQSQKKLEQLLQSFQPVKQISSNLAYMELNERVPFKQVPNLQQFKYIYNRGLQRYKITYKPNQRKLSWGNDDVIVFLWVTDKYCLHYSKKPKEFVEQDWQIIAKVLPFRTAEDCMFKFLDLCKTCLSKNPWTTPEQIYLKDLVESETGSVSWTSISRELYKKFPNVYRSSKQCRQHYNLNKTAEFNRAKKAWTAEEDLALMFSYQKNGKKWKTISKSLIGRSQNAIKNRFTLLLSKYCKDSVKDTPIFKLIDQMKQKIIENQNAIMQQKSHLLTKLRLMSHLSEPKQKIEYKQEAESSHKDH